jgi:hypothetical protein
MREQTIQQLRVVHRLPARLRLAVVPAERQTLESLRESASEIRGVTEVSVGVSGRTLVVRFDPLVLGERTLLMRLTLALSAQTGHRPVQLLEPVDRVRLDPSAIAAGVACAGSSILNWLAPAARVTGAAGWVASALTLLSVGRGIVNDLAAGKPRPEALGVVHLLSKLRSSGRGSGALLSWLLYNGPVVTELMRGRGAGGVEVRPVTLRQAVGDDRGGTHVEILTRPIPAQPALAGAMLTPATLVSAAFGFLAYALEKRERLTNAVSEPTQ